MSIPILSSKDYLFNCAYIQHATNCKEKCVHLKHYS